jgi:hypothetical protein
VRFEGLGRRRNRRRRVAHAMLTLFAWNRFRRCGTRPPCRTTARRCRRHGEATSCLSGRLVGRGCAVEFHHITPHPAAWLARRKDLALTSHAVTAQPPWVRRAPCREADAAALYGHRLRPNWPPGYPNRSRAWSISVGPYRGGLATAYRGRRASPPRRSPAGDA